MGKGEHRVVEDEAAVQENIDIDDAGSPSFIQVSTEVPFDPFTQMEKVIGVEGSFDTDDGIHEPWLGLKAVGFRSIGRGPGPQADGVLLKMVDRRLQMLKAVTEIGPETEINREGHGAGSRRA